VSYVSPINLNQIHTPHPWVGVVDFVVKAVKSIKNMTQESQKESNIQASRWLLFAIMCGIAFLVIKVTEFSHIFGMGMHLSTNKYFMFYIMLTVFHFLHVLLGSGILLS